MNEQILKLKIVEMCGPHCVGVEEGEVLFNKIFPILKNNGKVCLDFSGVQTITSSFLNASIGTLVGQLDVDYLRSGIKYEGLQEDDQQLIELVIRNAKEHFAKTDSLKKAEEDIIKNNSEEESR
jgi:hypothetical protein